MLPIRTDYILKRKYSVRVHNVSYKVAKPPQENRQEFALLCENGGTKVPALDLIQRDLTHVVIQSLGR